MKLRIGTRGSALAMTQARGIARDIEALGHQSEIVTVKTRGDADQVRPFAQVGEPGLFVREIEHALIDETIDVAVHCYKDLPSLSPRELTIAAVPAREDPRDRLIALPAAHRPDEQGLPLARGAKVGTASARRQALVRDLRPDLRCILLRGNVPTRVKKLQGGELDAILLAAAGLERLERAEQRGEGEAPSREHLVELDLEPESFVPAPSQGALALQVRARDGEVREVVAALDDPASRRSVSAERELLALVEAGCQVPFGAFCREAGGDRLELFAALEADGELLRAHAFGHDPLLLAAAVFDNLTLYGGERNG